MIQEQIREKAKIGSGVDKISKTMATGLTSNAVTTSSGVKAVALASIHKTQMTESLKNDMRASPARPFPSQPAAPLQKSVRTTPVRTMSIQRPTPPSPFDTYVMSDGEEFSVDSEDEEEAHQRAKKYIPVWARPENLKVILEKQHRRTDNPDETFFRVTTCDLEAIFGIQPHKNYHSRHSTGDWGDDRNQPLEQLIPKRSGAGY
jgi:hypothetical protein